MDRIFFIIPLAIYLLAGDMTSKGEVVKDVVGSLTFEQVENLNNRSLTAKGREVHYLLQDEFKEGNVLLAKGHAIYTLDLTSQEFHLIAGNENSFGYRNGVGSDVRFWNIGGMITMPNDPSMTLISDSNNFCIRIIKRANNLTSQFAGKCRNSGYVDGSISKAQFSYTTDVAGKQRAKAWRMYTWDVGSTYNVLRYIDIVVPTNNSVVGTVASTQGQASLGVKSLDFFPNSNTLCVGILSAIFTVNLDNSLIRPILHGSTPVDGRFSTSGIGTILGAVFLDKTTLLVADALFWKLRVIDFAAHQISSICLTNSYTRTKFTPGTPETCILSRPTFLLNQPLAQRVLIATNTGIHLLKYNVKDAKSAVTTSPMMENTDYQTRSPVSQRTADNRVHEMNVSTERGETSTSVESLISSEQMTHPSEVTAVNITRPILNQLTNQSRFPANTSLGSVAVSQTSPNSHVNQTDISMKKTKTSTSVTSLVTTERMTHPPEVTSVDTRQIMSQSTTQSTSPTKTSFTSVTISQTPAGRHSHEMNVSTTVDSLISSEQKIHPPEVISESITRSKTSRPANQSNFSEISLKMTANGKTSVSTNTVVRTNKPLTESGEFNGAEATHKTTTTISSASTTSVGKTTHIVEITSAQKSVTNAEPIAVTNSKVVGPDSEIKSAARRVHIHRTLSFLLAYAIQMVITCTDLPT